MGQEVVDDVESILISLKENKNYTEKKTILTQSIEKVKFRNRDQTLHLCALAIDEARMEKDTSFLLYLLQTEAIQNINFHNFQDASNALSEVEAISIKTLDTINLTSFYISKGFLNKRKNEYMDAIFYYEKGRDLALRSNDMRRYGNATNRLGLLMFSIGEYEKACSYYRQVIALEKNRFKSVALINLMETYVKLGKIDSTRKYLKMAEPELKNSSRAKVEIYRTKSFLAQEDGNIDLAIEFMEQALDYSFEHDFVIEQLSTLLSLYDLSKEHKKQNRVELLDRAKKIAESTNNLEMLERIYSEYAQYYELKGQYRKAVEVYKEFMEVSLIHENVLKKDISEMDKNIYRLFKKENENNQLFLDNQYNEIRLNKRRRQRNFWLLLSILLATATGITYRLLRQKQYFLKRIKEKQDLIEQAVEEKQMLLQEMNHRIKNNYNIIGDMLKHTQTKDDIEYVRTKLNAMAVIHSILLEYSESQTTIDSIDFFPKLLRHIKKSYFAGREVDIKTSIEQQKIFSRDALLLGIVINEIFTNIWKHEDFTVPIFVDFNYDKEKMDVISIEWNSLKMKQSSISSHGQGQRILKSLLVQNGGELDLKYGDKCKVVIRI